ncbi:MAG: ATP-dependent 6-phosphofructokinase [Actinobacteria bacterium]|nr:ATP-dependent 6-phosphofructokinase [Actinomycetota bacterium]
MAIGVLTAGGDCPGLNAAIRGVVARATDAGADVVGIESGWDGLMGGEIRALTRDDVRGILAMGGTILGTSRTDPYLQGEGYASVAPAIQEWNIETLVVIGGDGSLRTASRLERDGGVKIVGIPKTIDNDIGDTDYTLGFHTAVQIVVDAIDRLTTTAEAHNRVMVVEVMGRTTGWIAAAAGIAGGAEAILVPERDVDYAELASRIEKRHRTGHDYSVVVVAEGVAGPEGDTTTRGSDAFGYEMLGGVGDKVAADLAERTGFETRVTTLGYLQRGGTPTAFDRLLGTRLGVKAAELALEGRTGVMMAAKGGEIRAVDLARACEEIRDLDTELIEVAGWFVA